MIGEVIKENHCPKCGSIDLDWEGSEAYDYTRLYPATCLSCETTFTEYYKEVFIGCEIHGKGGDYYNVETPEEALIKEMKKELTLIKEGWEQTDDWSMLSGGLPPWEKEHLDFVRELLSRVNSKGF